MAKRRNRFMQEAEDETLENPGEVLTTVPVPIMPEPKEEKVEEKPEEKEAKKEEKPVEKQEEKVEEKKERPESPINDILLDLVTKAKPKQETYGFYLDNDVHDEIVRLAKQSKTNKSRYLNALLRRILFNE